MRRSSVIGSQPPQHFVLELLRLLSQAEAPLLFVFLLSFSFFFRYVSKARGARTEAEKRIPRTVFRKWETKQRKKNVKSATQKQKSNEEEIGRKQRRQETETRRNKHREIKRGINKV